MKMKKILFLLVALLPLAAMAKPKANVRWCSFNIRLINEGDAKAGYGWDVRKPNAVQYILDNDLDVIGMQEVLYDQKTYLEENLKGYECIGVGRTDGKTKGEYACIFYKKDKFEVLDQGNFWLSETPDVPGSRGWDAALERIVTWGKFRDKKSGKIFMAVNTHFDHIGTEARKQSALLIIEKIREIVGKRPAIVTGDFNVTDQDEAYKTMVSNKFVLRDAFKISPSHGGVNYSFHSYAHIPVEKREKIDFIFVTPSVDVIRTGIPKEVPGHFLSDHNPHWADLQF